MGREAGEQGRKSVHPSPPDSEPLPQSQGAGWIPGKRAGHPRTEHQRK